MARRGMPRIVFSDNGTNFVASVSILGDAKGELSEQVIQQYASRENIEWHFNPPCASHMGGSWERMIRSIRRIMAGILPRTVRLTDEKLVTIFCEVEGILNGRPLTKLSDDPRDPAPLTPNHLLIMRQGSQIPPGVFSRHDVLRSRWRHVQHITDQFWRHWIKLYLPLLQQRQKWTDVQRNLQIGDLVMIMGENTPRNVWPLALVIEINTGRDALVRSARLKTAKNELVRPITKLVMLEGNGEMM